MTDTALDSFPTFSIPAVRPTDFDLAEFSQIRENLDRLAHKKRVAQRNSRHQAGLFQAGGDAVRRGEKIAAANTETLAHYAHRGLRLFNDYRWEINISPGNEEYCVVGFSEWLLAKRLLCAKGTWRCVRAAASYYIGKIPDDDSEEAIALIEMAGQPFLREAVPDQKVLSFLPYEQFKETRDSLRFYSRGEHASWLADFMLAGVATGLGADEWKLTKLVHDTDSAGNERTQLYVFDLRCTSLGVPGSYRILDISTLSADARGAILRISDQGRHWASTGQYALRKHAISTLLTTTFAHLFPQRSLLCTLDSIQQQAIANFQSTHGREEISALLGDAFIGLLPPNYAHRDRSWADSCVPGYPQPDKKAINRFNRILRIYDDRKAIKNCANGDRS